MNETSITQDNQLITLVVDCNSIEDANKLYALLEETFIDSQADDPITLN